MKQKVKTSLTEWVDQNTSSLRDVGITSTKVNFQHAEKSGK